MWAVSVNPQHHMVHPWSLTRDSVLNIARVVQVILSTAKPKLLCILGPLNGAS